MIDVYSIVAFHVNIFPDFYSKTKTGLFKTGFMTLEETC
jgi:hypothetical protein